MTHFWCHKILPLVYDNSLSYMEMVCKLVDKTNELIKQEQSFGGSLEEFGVTLSELEMANKELKHEIECFKNGDYIGKYIDALRAWLNENMQEMVADIVKYVAFGLNDDGYFIAYIPKAWGFIKFDTDVDPNSENYGKLQLRW